MSGQDRTKGAYFSTHLDADLEPHPIMVMHDELLGGEETRATFLHELAHRFIHQRFAHLPIWLDEGLAQLYSTLRIEGGRAVFGGAAPSTDFWSPEGVTASALFVHRRHIEAMRAQGAKPTGTTP